MSQNNYIQESEAVLVRLLDVSIPPSFALLVRERADVCTDLPPPVSLFSVTLSAR